MGLAGKTQAAGSGGAHCQGGDRRDVPPLPRPLQRQGKPAAGSEAVENSDCLLSIGYRPIDLTTGDFTGSLPADVIRVRGHSVDVGEDNYQAVTLKEVLRGVTDPAPHVTNRAVRQLPGCGRRQVIMPTARPS